MLRLLFIFLLLSAGTLTAQLTFSEKNIDLGFIKEAYEIKGDVVVTNTSSRKIFLMRADADRGVKVYTSKKTLAAGDTCLIVISFIPESSGKFRKKIDLVATDQAQPYQIVLSGNIDQVKTNDRMACVYFGKQRPRTTPVREEPIVLPAPNPVRDNPPKMPATETPKVSVRPEPQHEPVKEEPKEVKDEFSEKDYKPNNILFLVDISSSMRDSLKLPVMKLALHKLIDAVRGIDTITFVTYASRVKVVAEAVNGADKTSLHTLVDSLKAKGMTAGKTAILFSQQLSQKHFIQGGNNQIIIATDGEFKFEQEDFINWKKRQGTKKIVLSTVAFGNEKTALRNLKEIAYKGEGSFIHIPQKSGSENKLLDEIKLRSRR